MKFYLGTHKSGWLKHVTVPLFVSRRALAPRKTLPRALAPWALDSGGFTELASYGEWRTTPAQYISEVRRFAAEVGRLEWAAPQDWMCEPSMLTATGRTVAYHQAATIASVLELRAELGPVIIPVVQGWTVSQYLDHADAYTAAGIDLAAERLVGIGSVCRRYNGRGAVPLVTRLADRGIRLHAFGMKSTGLALVGGRLSSSDSLAWSYAARARKLQLEGCSHACCSNCLRWALQWRAEVLATLEPSDHPRLL